MTSSLAQPNLIKYLYGSALAIHSADFFLFYTIHPSLFSDREKYVESDAARFWARSAANGLIPFALAGWLLRDFHIRHSYVGRVMGSCFALFHTLSVAMYSWSRWTKGQYRVEPFWGIAGLHGAWAGVALWGLFYA